MTTPQSSLPQLPPRVAWLFSLWPCCGSYPLLVSVTPSFLASSLPSIALCLVANWYCLPVSTLDQNNSPSPCKPCGMPFETWHLFLLVLFTLGLFNIDALHHHWMFSNSDWRWQVGASIQINMFFFLMSWFCSIRVAISLTGIWTISLPRESYQWNFENKQCDFIG